MDRKMMPEKEVRLAIVMYGGVSLAIYINGIAQELLSLVRSTAAVGGSTGDPECAEPSTEPVYRKLASLLARESSAGACSIRGTAEEEIEPVRFVIDIISGTSAGGINGIFLAKALATGGRMDELQRLWVEEGDLSLLINDSKSRARSLPVQDPPASLLNSQRMYVKLLEAFHGMDGGTASAAAPGIVDEIDLFVTTTDIKGVSLPIRLADMVVYERRHRTVFHLTAGSERNDFTPRHNPFLAFAARCTSSFPFAFEPMSLCDIDDVLDRFPQYRNDPLWTSGSKEWEVYYTDYLNPRGVKTIDFTKRPFGDGGYLDNKPFSYAVDTLMARNADIPVDRKLIYIEPSPEHPEEEPDTESKPDFAENVVAALLTLPRYETVREDLKRVLERNRLVERVKRIQAGIDRDLQVLGQQHRPLDDAEWATMDLAELLEVRGPGYLAYHRLLISAVTDDLARMVAGLTGFDEKSDYLLAIRSLIRVWREGEYGLYHSDNKPKLVNSFLLDFDFGYPLRRLNFLREKIDHLWRMDDGARSLLHIARVELPGEIVVFRAELSEIKQRLNDVFAALRRERSLCRCRFDKKNPLLQSLQAFDLKESDLQAILGKEGEASDGASAVPESVVTMVDRRAVAFVSANPHVAQQIRSAAEEFRKHISGILSQADRQCVQVLRSPATSPARKAVDYFFTNYDLYDTVTFPILYNTGAGEADQVEVVRISPYDATALVNEREVKCKKLAGTKLANFSAFLERRWRESDILWGRLDGAERIISSLLPSHPEKNALIGEAHGAIICAALRKRDSKGRCELLAEVMMRTDTGKPKPDALLSFMEKLRRNAGPWKTELDRLVDDGELCGFYLRSFAASKNPGPEETLRSAARATTVVGKMLEGLSRKYGVGGKAAAWIIRLGRVGWGFVEVAVPRAVTHLIFHYWLRILYLFEVLLIVGGIAFVSPPVQNLGWQMLLVTLAVNATVALLTDFIMGKKGIIRAVKFGVIAVVVALIGIGFITVKTSYREGGLRNVITTVTGIAWP